MVIVDNAVCGDGRRTADPAPLVAILRSLMIEPPDRNNGPGPQDQVQGVLGHVLRLSERITVFRALLQNALAVNPALAEQRQKDEMRLVTEPGYARNPQKPDSHQTPRQNGGSRLRADGGRGPGSSGPSGTTSSSDRPVRGVISVGIRGPGLRKVPAGQSRVLVPQEGIEPPTGGLEGRCSIP